MKRALLALTFACNTTSTTPPTPPPTASAPPPPASASASASATTPAKTSCAVDADCSLMSSYCGDLPCACVPYLTSAGAPKCNQPNTVKCLVDPCQRKAPACQEGKCVVTAGPTK
jgi:hypothetical protein